jgi:hypothetical protein
MDMKRKRKFDRRFLIAACAAALAAISAIAIAIFASRGARTISLGILVPFKSEASLEAFGSELREFGLRRRGVETRLLQMDYSDIDRATESGSIGWDIAVGSARLADGRPAVAAPALPLYGSLWELYYSKSVLAEAGIVPAAGAPGLAGALAAGTAGIAELREACASVARAGATPIALGSLYGWPLAVWIEALMAAAGDATEAGRLIESSFDAGSPALAGAIAEFRSLIEAGFVESGFAAKDWPASLRELVAGKAGFCLLSEELVASLAAAERGRIGSLPLPGSAGKDGRAWAIGSVSYIALSSGLEGKRRREAEALVGWIASEGAADRLSRRMGTRFFSGGRGPYRVLPSIASSPSSAIVSRIKDAVAGL